MKKVYQSWETKADGVKTFADSITFGTLDFIESERLNGELTQNSILLHTIEAKTYEEAMTIHYAKMNWGSYRPTGKAENCPNNCGAQFYPQGSAECPNCGQIC